MKKIALDGIDVRILSAVQHNGQISKARLSELVNLSPTPCWNRLTRLKNAGLITGYRGEIAVDKMLDLTKVIVVVALKSHSRANFERFEHCIQGIDDIVECSATGGGADYVMKVVSNSLQEFQNFIDQMLDQDLGIERYYIYVVTREVKSAPMNLPKLLRNRDLVD